MPKLLIFPQIIRSTQLNTTCLQQSRKKKTRYDCLFYEKHITRRVRRRFHEANIGKHCCGSMQTDTTLLRRSQNNRNVGTCLAKSSTGFKLYATGANKCQHCCGSMQADATSHNIVGPNNVGCCWPTMLGPFAWALNCKNNIGLKTFFCGTTFKEVIG